MKTIAVENVSKSFGNLAALDSVSFDVFPGEIFGLLGPNGAGKTTTIRIILHLIKPDQGMVEVLGGPFTEKKKDQIGYLPEERGLYQDVTVERCLLYLASLKGLSGHKAKIILDPLLDRFELSPFRKKKVKELSKGMQQKAQLIATLIHRPKLVIIDEPFTALDPVNTQMVKAILRDLKDQGTSIVMSTHQMHQVQELCDRMLVLNHGKIVLYGSVGDIRRQFSEKHLKIRTKSALPEQIPGVIAVDESNHLVNLQLGESTDPQSVLSYLVAQNIELEHFEIATPDLDEIFIRSVSSKSE